MRGYLEPGVEVMRSTLLPAPSTTTRGLCALASSMRHLRVGADDDLVADAGLAGRGAVEADDARAGLALDDVGGEALAVVDVVDLDVLVDEQTRLADQVSVDRERALIVQVALGDGGAVQLASQNLYEHSVQSKSVGAAN